MCRSHTPTLPSSPPRSILRRARRWNRACASSFPGIATSMVSNGIGCVLQFRSREVLVAWLAGDGRDYRTAPGYRTLQPNRSPREEAALVSSAGLTSDANAQDWLWLRGQLQRRQECSVICGSCTTSYADGCALSRTRLAMRYLAIAAIVVLAATAA